MSFPDGASIGVQANVDDVAASVEDLVLLMRDEEPSDPIAFLQDRLQVKAEAAGRRRLSASMVEPMRSPDRPKGKHRSGSNLPVVCRGAHLTIVVLGASGDLAKKKTYPAIFRLFADDALPLDVSVVGYARSKIELGPFREQISKYFPKELDYCKEAFLECCTYQPGSYTEAPAFAALQTECLNPFEKDFCEANRLFYLALPPSAFVDACKGIKGNAMGTRGWNRVIVEKPFGRDTESSQKVSQDLAPLFNESQIFRIDHYLGKELVQNIVTMRFANHIFNALWSNKHIANVQITFKEQIGTEGRGGYFDSFGIIRDVVQNHLTQILSLIAMDKPASLSAEDVRDAKVRVLRSVLPLDPKDCVLGQYTGNATEKGYLDDPTVPKGSKCPTFASMVLNIHNDRWAGVPFIIRAGKAMDQKTVLVRVQFKEEIQPFGDMTQRNELVIRAQPQEAIYLKIGAKTPGMTKDAVEQTELDLTYSSRYSGVRLPDAYETLIREVILGNSTNFVRSDELDAAWKIYTPLLHAIDRGELTPIPYPFGSRGPEEADKQRFDAGYMLPDRSGSTYCMSPC